MEKEGLQWVLRHLQENGLTTKVLVTDRYQQINKWIRENYPCIKHYYDIWHVAKGMLNFLTFCIALEIDTHETYLFPKESLKTKADNWAL